MLVRLLRFNTYLLLLAMLLAAATGCQTEKHKKKKMAAMIRLHLEVSRFEKQGTEVITVPREHPIELTVMREGFLTESDVEEARVIETTGGFAMSIRFDTRGKWLLEQYTAGNTGRHLAIRCAFGPKLEEERWLGAPLITHRLSDGVLTFTPDATRAEADEIALGLNNVAKKIQKSEMF